MEEVILDPRDLLCAEIEFHHSTDYIHTWEGSRAFEVRVVQVDTPKVSIVGEDAEMILWILDDIEEGNGFINVTLYDVEFTCEFLKQDGNRFYFAVEQRAAFS